MAEEKKDVMNEEVEVEETVEDTVETTDDVETSENNEVEENSEEEKEEGADEESEEAPKKEGFFKKKKDKRDEQIEELNDKVKRQMAEFDNFRKRTEKEKSMMFDMGAKTIIEKILPVVDNLERAAEAQAEKTPFYEGVCLVEKQLFEILEKIGVSKIEALGETFDPNVHNAVMHIDDEEKGPGEIVEEFAKGYKLKEKVIRYSMVKVAN